MTDNADRPAGSGQSDDLLEARPQPASRTAKVLARAEERKRRAEPADARTYAFARVVLRLLFGLCVGPEIVGRENVPRRGPLLVVGNHLSFLEPPLVTVAVPRRITYLALYELFDIGWLAPALRVMGALPVKRGGARDLDALRAALHLLERDEAVGIFPEGERSIRAGLLRANPGVSLLVTRSGATILPVAITGTERLTSIPALLLARLRRPRVRIVIGRPFRPTVAGARPDHQALADEIMGEVAALLPPAYRGAYADAARTPAAQRAPGAPDAGSGERA